jgi:hypothetical protein
VLVYELGRVEGYEWVIPNRREDFGAFNLPAHPVASSWTPPPVHLMSDDESPEEGEQFKFSDMPSSGRNTLVVTERAWRSLAPVIADYVELLPLACPERPLWVAHPLRYLDGLDEEASKVHRHSRTGQVIAIEHPRFIEERIGEVPIFKLSTVDYGATLVTEPVKEATVGLAGVVWRPVGFQWLTRPEGT